IASLFQYRKIKSPRFFCFIPETHRFITLYKKVTLPQLLQKLVIRKTFTCDCIIASVLGIAVIYITETNPDNLAIFIKSVVLIRSQFHPGHDFQGLFYNGLVIAAAIQQVLLHTVLKISNTSCQADPLLHTAYKMLVYGWLVL